VRNEGDESVCAECGLVVDTDRIDRGPEWRSFDDDETDRKRTGAPLTRSRHDRGLSTEIGSSKQLRLTGRKRRQLARLRREHSRSRTESKRDRNQIYVFCEIERIAGSLSLPEDVVEQACVLFESAQKDDLVRGRSLEGFAAATVYAVCRVRSISRTVEEVAEAGRADDAELQAAYDALNRELGLPTGPIDPREYVPRFASELDLPKPVATRARELIDLAREERRIGGRAPRGVAVGALYAAAQEDAEAAVECTQDRAATVADVSPVTLRSAANAVTGES
jgi:transcription initiation factor TFIIB